MNTRRTNVMIESTPDKCLTFTVDLNVNFQFNYNYSIIEFIIKRIEVKTVHYISLRHDEMLIIKS